MPSPFTMTAVGGCHAIDRLEVIRALRLLTEPGQTFELRGITPSIKDIRQAYVRSRVCKGNDLAAATDAASELSDHNGVYVTLNPCQDTLKKAAADKDIESREWLLIDVDAIREADTNATDDEKETAENLALECFEYLTSLGWCPPIGIDSGNGWHLLYPISLPNDALSHALCKSALESLAARFDRPGAKVDTSVHNAARISKLPGTWVRKGPESLERPNRMARIVMEPIQAGEIVTAEQLLTLSAPIPITTNGSPFAGKVTNGDIPLTGILRSAVNREFGRICMAPVGDRNNRLNQAAHTLGGYAGWPGADVTAMRADLLRAALQCGLGEPESRKTIESGFTSGVAKPFPIPPPQTNGPAKGPTTNTLKRKLTIGLDEITPEKVDWLWEDRLAPGFITIFAGRTGMGKSFVLCDVAARLSRGEAPPFSTLRRAPMRTLMISEDPIKQMLGPRLIELGAVRKLVRFMDWESMGVFTMSNVDMLDEACAEFDEHPGLLVIDPPSNFLGKVDEHKNAEVRQSLKGLIAWIDRHKVTCVLITHINKATGKGLDGVERIVGSVAWGSAARMTICFAQDPDDKSIIICGGTKNNLGETAAPLAYQILKTIDLARIEWVGKTDMNIEDAMNKVKRKSRGACAVEWLAERFREKFEWEAEELRKAAAEAGISKNALWSPEAAALPIGKKQRTNAAGDRTWWWTAGPGWPPAPKIDPDQNGHVGNLGTCDGSTIGKPF